MNPQQADAAPAAASAQQPQGCDEAGILEAASGWLEAVASRFRSTARLALAEVRLAAMSVVLMVVLGLIAAVFTLGAWGLLMAGAVMGLIAAGMSLWVALVLLGAAHVAITVVLIHWIRGLSMSLELPTTRQRLRDPAGLQEERNAA